MEEMKLTALSGCAGCGAKVGAGVLSRLLAQFPIRRDPRLLVGYETNDDACVYQLSDELALVQTTDFFPPIVDDPYLFGQIAAANALSDIYAMGGQPKLALNLLCISEKMDADTIQAILRGGFDKVAEAGALIAGGHSIHGAEPIYGLAVSGFVHPQKILTNSGAQPGDVLILTKPLGVGILTTAAKAGLAPSKTMERIYRQMAALNSTAGHIISQFPVHSCTDVTGFSLLGHSCEMARSSGCTLHICSADVPWHPEAPEFARMGLIPSGAYRNREFVGNDLSHAPHVSRSTLDILFDPQTSGGLLFSLPESDAAACLHQLQAEIPAAAIIGYVTERQKTAIVVE